MKRLSIDVSNCKTKDDVYAVLLAALEAPGWHGRNLDALLDSVTSDINRVSPPYIIEVTGYADTPPEIASLLQRMHELFKVAREERAADVHFNTV